MYYIYFIFEIEKCFMTVREKSIGMVGFIMLIEKER